MKKEKRDSEPQQAAGNCLTLLRLTLMFKSQSARFHQAKLHHSFCHRASSSWGLVRRDLLRVLDAPAIF